MDKVHFSTGKDDWETPQWLFNQLDDEFHFTLDPCCTAENAKCRKYYTKAENGLEQDWKGETVFCNPPYSRGKKGAPGQEAWIKKCFEESKKAGTTCVMLLPARTDTKAFHTYIYGYAEIRFIRGRLKFGGSTNSAPFPSMIVVFKGKDCISLLPTFRNMLLNAPIGQNLWKRKQPTEMCEETNRTFEQIVRFW